MTLELGKSLEIVPQGITRLRIGGDHFTWYVA